jgi:uncharacterized protein YbjQ (UPF0145 family)
MLMTTTDGIEGRKIVEYLGIVSGDAVVGANLFRDLFARVRDIVGGRAGGYEKALAGAKEAAMEDLAAEAHALGADAVVGVDLDYESVGDSMLMVSVNGTAVRLG